MDAYRTSTCMEEAGIWRDASGTGTCGAGNIETDLEGHARVLCDRVDIGAYECGIGDMDCDQTVDLYDFADGQTGITGPNGDPYPDGCEPFDFNYDGFVDLRDFAGMQAVFAE